MRKKPEYEEKMFSKLILYFTLFLAQKFKEKRINKMKKKPRIFLAQKFKEKSFIDVLVQYFAEKKKEKKS